MSLASKLGGLGKGWRRPPHNKFKETINYDLYMGSSFSITPENTNSSVQSLLENLKKQIGELAKNRGIKLVTFEEPPLGSIVSVWHSMTWNGEIVHDICSTNKKNRKGQKKPSWCGGQNRPSGYAICDRGNYYIMTVFDRKIEEKLRESYSNVWTKISLSN